MREKRPPCPTTAMVFSGRACSHSLRASTRSGSCVSNDCGGGGGGTLQAGSARRMRDGASGGVVRRAERSWCKAAARDAGWSGLGWVGSHRAPPDLRHRVDTLPVLHVREGLEQLSPRPATIGTGIASHGTLTVVAGRVGGWVGQGARAGGGKRPAKVARGAETLAQQWLDHDGPLVACVAAQHSHRACEQPAARAREARRTHL